VPLVPENSYGGGGFRSLLASGTATAPAAAANVATLGIVAAGIYRVTIYCMITTTLETQVLNWRLRSQAAGVVDLPSNTPLTTLVTYVVDYVTADGVNPLAIGAAANATAATVYTASIMATRVA